MLIQSSYLVQTSDICPPFQNLKGWSGTVCETVCLDLELLKQFRVWVAAIGAKTTCLTQMAVYCTLLVALNGSLSGAKEWCKPVVTPSTSQNIGFTIQTLRQIIAYLFFGDQIWVVELILSEYPIFDNLYLSYPIVTPNISTVICALDTILTVPHILLSRTIPPHEKCWFARSKLYFTC